MTNQALSLL